MWIALDALNELLPQPLSHEEATALLPMLGFPIDGAEAKEGTIVLDVDITANRGDVMSHRGVARELAAKLGLALAPLPMSSASGKAVKLALAPAPLPTSSAPGEVMPEIHLDVPECPLYATAVLTLGKPDEARGMPAEVARFLDLLGSGAKQLPAVDASNELLHRFGHPTHAFDADQLQGVITVRFAREGETLTTLDGVKQRELKKKDLVIADENGPVALAGVMGGDASKVTEKTTRVLLESAYFDPRTVRLMARRHNLHTDASHRFGRGADPAMAEVARDLLVQRLQEWTGATLESAWTVGAMPAPAPAIHLPWTLLDRCAGEAVDHNEATTLLQRLGCMTMLVENGLSVVPPTWRHDLAIAEDLAEEVLRLRGYDRIPIALPHVDADPEPLNADYVKRQRIAQRLAHLGFHQTVTYGFVDSLEGQGWADYCPFSEQRTLKNPLGQEYSVMRGTLLRSLRDVAERNLANGAREVRLFEIAPVFKWDPNQKELREVMTLALNWAGKTGGEDPFSPVREIATAEGKNWLTGILRDLGVPEKNIDGFSTPRWKMVGYLIERSETVYSETRAQLGWQFEIPLSSLPDPEDRIIPAYRPFSRHPAVERDLSLLVDLAQRHADLVAALRAALPKELQSVGCVDVFRHKSLPAGKQAWLMRFRFQADRTLTGAEVDGWMKDALAAAETCGARIRA